MRDFLPTARPSLSDAEGDAMRDDGRGVTVRGLRNRRADRTGGPFAELKRRG